jgi:hypothetical protein
MRRNACPAMPALPWCAPLPMRMRSPWQGSLALPYARPCMCTACARNHGAPWRPCVTNPRPAHTLALLTTHKRSSTSPGTSARPGNHAPCMAPASCWHHASATHHALHAHPRPWSQALALPMPWQSVHRMHMLAHGALCPGMPMPILATHRDHDARNRCAP